MVWASWSECVASGKKLLNGKPGRIDRIKTVTRVDFRDFVKSWRTLDERPSEGEIQAVKEVLGIIQHLKSVWLEDCNLCEDHLRILHDVFEGVKIDDLILFISKKKNIGVEGWYYVGQIVLQSKVKKLYAQNCDVTDECLERFMQGMDGAQLDVFDISCNIGDSKNVDSINVLLKLLPLSCQELQLYGWELSEDQEVELQKKLDEDCHKSLTIIYGNLEREVAGGKLYLKASPKELPLILPGVEGLKARNTNGSVWLEWDSLSIANVLYYIIVEDYYGKAVGEPIDTSDTRCPLSSLQSNEIYYFFIWGFTNDGISKRVAGIDHYTGKIRKSRKGTSLNKRKRTGDVLETEASKVKKRKGKKGSPKEGSTVSSWLATERQKEHLVGQASNMASAIDYGRNEEKVQQVINGLQEKMEKQEEKINKLMKDNEIMKREIADLKKNGGKPSQLRRKKKDKETQTEKIATANRFTRRTSISFSDDIRNQILFSPMKTAKDVEENEKRLDDKQYRMKLVEFLSEVGGCGKEAICRIMEKLFSNDLAQQFNWKGGGKNEKKSLHKLKLMEVIYRAGIAMNINNKDCEDAARKWLKNASDREGGRKRRARAKKNL